MAEPVGSCTDLIATVVLPLRRIYGEDVVISPFSVVLDGRRALASLGGRRTPGDFSKDVGYIYQKQIEEAELVLVNKVDLLTEEDVVDLLARLESNFPGKEVFVLSARTGVGLDAWAERIVAGESGPQRLMDVDYERYGSGEALLGWFNAEVVVEGVHSQTGDAFLIHLAEAISSALATQPMEVAHFKMALADADGRLGVINQVMGGTSPEISRSFGGDFRHGRLTVNLRAEGDPERLREIVENCVREMARDGMAMELRGMEAFRPGQLVPVEGFTAVFEAMLDGIPVHLNCAEEEWRRVPADRVVFTGSIDDYFHGSLGRLEYRSLDFRYTREPKRGHFQVNECNRENAWTRAVDHSHWLD